MYANTSSLSIFDFNQDEPQQKRSDSPGGYDALRQQNRQEYDRRRNYQQPTKPAEPQQNQKPVEDESKRGLQP